MTSTCDVTETIKSPRRRRHWRRWLISAPAAVLIAELLLRVIFGLAHPVLTQVDSACGYFCKPDQDVERFFAHNHINHFGMRSDDVTAQKPPDTLRLLFVGDSVTYGTTFVDQSEIFTSRVAQGLPAALGRNVQVLNASAGGWAIANEVGYLKSRGTFDSDWVIFVINSGDIGQPFAAFTASLNFPTSNPWSAIGEAWRRYAQPRLFHIIIAGDQGREAQPDPMKELPHNLQLLEEAQTLVQANHGQMALVFTPFQKSDFPDPHPPAALIDWASRHHIPLVDLTPDFLKHPVQELTFDGIHPRVAGDQLIAKNLLKALPPLIKGTLSSTH